MQSLDSENQIIETEEKMSNQLNKYLLVLNIAMLGLGNCGAPLQLRLYFLKGGKAIWQSSPLLTAGWPLVFLPLVASYFNCRKSDGQGKLVYIASAVLGLLTGLDDFLNASGIGRLTVSTSSLIIATQLVFNAGFGFLLVKQKFTACTVNTIFLLSIGAVVLALPSNSDMPAHGSKGEYYIGFFMVLGASALYGFVLPAIELTNKKAKQNITCTLVMEMQMVTSFFATAFCAAGMLINKEFQAIPREESDFLLGEAKYHLVLVLNTVLWQFFFMGAVGVISCTSSLLSGIIIAALLPLIEILAVLFYHERFKVAKGISPVLSLWGFMSSFYGEIQRTKKKKNTMKSSDN